MKKQLANDVIAFGFNTALFTLFTLVRYLDTFETKSLLLLLLLLPTYAVGFTKHKSLQKQINH